jgi:competence protein ComEC
MGAPSIDGAAHTVGDAGVVPVARLEAPSMLSLGATDLALFVLNVGDGDGLVLRLPATPEQPDPSYAVIDAFDGPKTIALIESLGAGPIRFVCATHPHYDHIRGLDAIIAAYSTRIEEFWDSGFRYTSATYRGLLDDLGSYPAIRFMRPTSGYELFVGHTQITVLSPSIALRNRYDTHGVDVNNASIVLRITYPVLPPNTQYPAAAGGPAAAAPKNRTLILGADAQTDAWGQVLQEFPHLDSDPKNWVRAIGAGGGTTPLACDFFKVSHHASKRGVNLELIERLGDRSGGSSPSFGPRWLVGSCASGSDSNYGFPHAVTQDLLREVRDPQAQAGGTHPPDANLGIHLTSQRLDPGGSPAGSVAYIVRADGSADLYRFGDLTSAPIALSGAMRVK